MNVRGYDKSQLAGDILVDVRDLRVYFPVTQGILFQRRTGWVHAVDGVSFQVPRGETFGLVGESGSGKSTLARALLQLHRPTGGSVRFNGIELTKLKGNDLRRLRREMQIIFQDPYASLDPRMTVGAVIGEPLELHHLAKGRQKEERIAELLQLVGLNPYVASRYPYEFSGGQRQRVAIARALAVEPKFLICDEPLSALDISVQAQIINLLEELQDRLGLTYLFISHDLAAVRHVSDRIAVMYAGKIVELAPVDELYRSPLHPYTRALLSAVPIPDPVRQRQRKRLILSGEPPSPVNPPPGCRFHPRCPFATELCKREEPALVEAWSGHWVACHYWKDMVQHEGGSQAP